LNTFHLSASDGDEGKRLSEHKFTITLVPVNNQSPRLTALPPTLHLAQGGSLPIGQAVVGVADEDTPLDELTVTLTRGPHSGRLERLTEGRNKVTVNQGGCTYSYFIPCIGKTI